MKKTRFNELSKTESYVLIGALLLVCLPFILSGYSIYINNQPREREFKVFSVDVYYYPEYRGNMTQVLTWGEGKYYFAGSWQNSFQVDHTYKVTYVQGSKAQRPGHQLIILELEDITQ